MPWDAEIVELLWLGSHHISEDLRDVVCMWHVYRARRQRTSKFSHTKLVSRNLTEAAYHTHHKDGQL